MSEVKLAFEILGFVISGLLILFWAAYAIAKGFYFGRPQQNTDVYLHNAPSINKEKK